MKKELAVQPRIADWIVEMQSEHNLPVDIIVGKNVEELRAITLIYDEEDENVMHWMVDKCVNRFIKMYG